jgi:hypothetical protein
MLSALLESGPSDALFDAKSVHKNAHPTCYAPGGLQELGQKPPGTNAAWGTPPRHYRFV